MNDTYLQELYRRRTNILDQLMKELSEGEKTKLHKELLFINEEISKEKMADTDSELY